ncbi:MAG: hypothetical protein ABR595_00025 [Psychroflexus sp.]
MNNLELKYNQLMTEVAEFKKEFESSEIFKKVEDKYKGFQILISPLHYKPDFMFVGINPGAGYYKSTGEISNRLEPESTMEYVHENYALARETKQLLKYLGLQNEDLSQAIKTNFYFLATENERDLNEIIILLDNMDFEKKSVDWNNRLIEMTQPKIIICEGKSAFTKVLQHQNLQAEWNGDVAHIKWGNTDVFGYKRIFSQIKAKEKLSKLILEVLR